MNWSQVAKKVRMLVAQQTEPAIYKEGCQPEHPPGRPEKGVHGAGPVVRGGDGGHRCHIRGHAQGGDQIPYIQPALGVGDEVDFFAVGLGQDLLHTLRQHGGVVFHRSPAVLPAEKYPGAPGFQRFGDAPPVADALPVPEPGAVHQQDGVEGAAAVALRFLHGWSLLSRKTISKTRYK